MVSDTLLAAAFAIFCWWSGTGAILWLDRQGGAVARWCLPAFSVLMGLSFWGVSVSMSASDSSHAYLGFASTIVMWGWHELAFLSGWLSGPRRVAMSVDARGWQRLRESVATLLWHELTLIFNFSLLVWMQSGQPNHTALCTFALLWCMRVSAKVNLFVGIPMHGEQYLPSHLKYLASYFRCAQPGIWFMASVGCATGFWFWLLWSGWHAHETLSANWLLLASLLGLAILEHLVMVMPWSMEKIWGWAMRQPETLAGESAKLGLGRE
jgi:putative photosynthetic complex assembly protein 2